MRYAKSNIMWVNSMEAGAIFNKVGETINEMCKFSFDYNGIHLLIDDKIVSF